MKFFLASLFTIRCVVGLKFLRSTTLGPDPQTVNRLNGESFQQDPLVTFNGFQYAALWEADAQNASIRHPCVARRSLTRQTIWEKFTLKDYNQTSDDGVSRGDGTLHMGFDQHDNPLVYRISKPGIATSPTKAIWSSEIFGPVLDHLPGLDNLDKSKYFINITYPRFLSLPASSKSPSVSDLLLELRVGRSGLGDDWLYRYTPSRGWSQIGKYLEGVNNNAYINGMDFDAQGSLHTTWTYRDYVNDIGQDVAVEAGPNGPENNHDMDYAYSPDLGVTWQNNWGQHVANTSAGEPILPVSAGITIFSIPKYGGILNQEAQTVDGDGRVHVLNRENTTGIERWYHYWRSTTKAWTRTSLPLPADIPSQNNVTGTPTVIGKRGKLVSLPSKPSSLLAILPSNAPISTALSIFGSTAEGHFRDWKVLWETSSGCGWEPLFDRYRLEEDVLSLYVVNGTDVQVWDFEL
ncbi:hypothetical protein EIP91_003719 [Steccherinum ochraceum]|uniref:Uncharacterized protein n=1 Tax=Steccherinum ochraceum TaxID=92696 RepID=A0A4V2MXJ1_9APHY|nr:hypothetical protein EIP91_003719 [Steccherinum ochraceum]